MKKVLTIVMLTLLIQFPNTDALYANIEATRNAIYADVEAQRTVIYANAEAQRTAFINQINQQLNSMFGSF